MRFHLRCRRGAVALEAAIAHSALFLLLLAMIAGGLGVFRYQVNVMLAREAARAASVKGSDYARATNQASPSQSQILTSVVQPLAAGMDLTRLQLQLEWIDGTTGQATPWDSSSKAPTTTDPTTRAIVNNRVRATTTYQWSPAFFTTGPYSFKSVSEQPMSF